jgi:pilus assembly protein CpaE
MTERSTLRALLVSVDESFVERMTRALYPECGVTHCRPQHDELVHAIKSYEPDVCIIDVDDVKWEDNHHLDLIEKANIVTAAPIIVASYELTTSLVVESIRAGARDACEKDITHDEVLAIIEGLFKRRRGRRGDHTADLITVLGTQPGVGATTTALAIAQEISRRIGPTQRILLIDLSMAPSEIPDLVAVEPHYYLTDAIQDTGRLDETFVENALSKMADLPLYILPLCRTSEEAYSLNDSDITILLSVLKTYFHTIVIDANWAWNSNLTTRFLLDANRPVICCSQSVTAIHAGTFILNTIRARASDHFAFDLVITRYSTKIYPWLEDVGAALGNTARIHTIPDDRHFVEMSRNLATPLVRKRRITKFEQTIGALVSTFRPDLPAQGFTSRWQRISSDYFGLGRVVQPLIDRWRKPKTSNDESGANDNNPDVVVWDDGGAVGDAGLSGHGSHSQ